MYIKPAYKILNSILPQKYHRYPHFPRMKIEFQIFFEN